MCGVVVVGVGVGGGGGVAQLTKGLDVLADSSVPVVVLQCCRHKSELGCVICDDVAPAVLNCASHVCSYHAAQHAELTHRWLSVIWR